MIRKIFTSVVLILLTAVILKAQLSTSSPYSRFGIGDLSFNGLGREVTMGHTGVGNQNPYHINPINPASYSAFIPNNFIFELGAMHKFTNFATSENSWYTNNTNLNYFIAGFSIKPWWGTSFGLQPISSVGYQIFSSDSLFVDDGYTNIEELYKGDGGLNRFYWGNSFQPIKNLSIGANISYIFGSVDRNTETLVYETNFTSTLSEKHRYLIKGFNYKLGMQFCDSIYTKKDTANAKFIYTLGLTFENKSKINSFDTKEVIRLIKMNGNSFKDTLVNDTIDHGKISLPQSVGLGFSVKYNQKLTICADYTIENWSNVLNFGDNFNLVNSSSLGLGFEFCNNEFSTIYRKTIRYRFGTYYQNTSLDLNSQLIKQYGITAGIGIPVKSSIINLGLEFGTRGTTTANLVKENFIMFNLNVSIYDMWFVKSKFY